MSLFVAAATAKRPVSAKPVLFPHALEKARGGVAAQDAGEQLEGETLGTCRLKPGEAEDELVLLRGLAPEREAGTVGRSFRLFGLCRGHGGKAPGELPQVLIREAARERGDDPGRGVVPGHESAQALARLPREAGAPPEDGPAQRAGEAARDEPLRRHVLGRVLVHVYLLLDYALFVFHVPLVEAGVEEHGAERIRGQGQVRVEHPGVEAGVVPRGVGVHLPADGVHPLGELGRGPARGAFEQHVLNEMGAARFGVSLVARAGPDPDAQGGRAHPVHMLANYPRAVGQNYPLVHCWHLSESFSLILPPFFPKAKRVLLPELDRACLLWYYALHP